MAFCGYLKQSTAVTIKLGPFVDDDGITAATGLTISQADVRLSKNGGDMAQKNESTACTHDEIGLYDCPLDATDTATVGLLTVVVLESGNLVLRQDYQVEEEDVYDGLHASGATLLSEADVNEQCDTALADAGVTTAVMANLNAPVGTVDAVCDAILVDTGTDGVVIAAAHDLYSADIHFTVDEANTQDEYTVTWFKNGARITSGVTSPTIQVVARSNGADLIAATAMTEIGSTESFKKDEGTARTTGGEAYLVIAAGTIDAGARSFSRLISRDSAA